MGTLQTDPYARVLDHPVFSGATKERVASLVQQLRLRHVDIGALIGKPEVGPCNLLLEGLLHSYVLVPDGRRLLVEIIRPGSFDGLLNVMGHHGHFTEAVKPSVVVSLSRSAIDELIEVEPRIAVNLVRLILDRLERREEQLESATHHEATRRVARLLLALARYLGGSESDRLVELRPRPTHLDLADMLGLRRETVTVHMSVLRRVSAARARGDHLLLDREVLQALAEGESPQRLPAGRALFESQLEQSAKTRPTRRPPYTRGSRIRG
jgi:CRP-like cAMP-binding protein